MRMRAVTVGVAAVLGVAVLPASAWAAAEVSAGPAAPGPWVSVELWDFEQDCKDAANEYVRDGTYDNASCTRAKKGTAEAWVLWGWNS